MEEKKEGDGKRKMKEKKHRRRNEREGGMEGTSEGAKQGMEGRRGRYGEKEAG